MNEIDSTNPAYDSFVAPRLAEIMPIAAPYLKQRGMAMEVEVDKEGNYIVSFKDRRTHTRLSTTLTFERADENQTVAEWALCYPSNLISDTEMTVLWIGETDWMFLDYWGTERFRYGEPMFEEELEGASNETIQAAIHACFSTSEIVGYEVDGVLPPYRTTNRGLLKGFEKLSKVLYGRRGPKIDIERINGFEGLNFVDYFGREIRIEYRPNQVFLLINGKTVGSEPEKGFWMILERAKAWFYESIGFEVDDWAKMA